MHLFIPAIWVTAGISLYVGAFYTSAALYLEKQPGFLQFGLLALLISFNLALTPDFYSMHPAEVLGTISRYKVILLCLIYPTAVWFIGTYTCMNMRKLMPWLIASVLIYGVFIIANIYSKGALFYTNFILDKPFVFPWGETVSNISATPGKWLWLFLGASYVIFIWALWRCQVMWHAGLRYKAIPLASYLLIQLAAVVRDRYFGISGTPFIPVGQFVFLALVLIMSFALLREMRQRMFELEQSLNALQTETERRRHVENRLHHMAYHDYLTDLPNRRLLREILNGALKHHHSTGQLGAIVFLDLDHFKTINDSLGHQVGDKLLQQIAERLRNALPESRCVSRLGGDEFAVVIGNLGNDRSEAEATAMRAAEVLRDSLIQPFIINHHELVVGTSIGVTLFPNEKVDVTGLFRQADLALYSAKAAGRNTAAVFAAQMQEDAGLRLVVEKGLRTALDKRELRIYFQPQLNMNGDLIGAEALLRWKHPEYGLMEPRHFISVAEETGLIHAIGDHVLSNVCTYIRKWNQAKLPTPPRLAINVSPWQLATAGFTRKVKRAIELADINPSRLTLEITENAVLQDIEEVANTIRELSSIGVRFSIDDFGSGYSALASLKKLPLHELKIDRIFISEMRIDPPDQFISTIISMAHNMGLYVIAEGVETEAQRLALANLGCHGYQGYLISKPMPVRDFERWLKARWPLQTRATHT
ncbi:MAG TPA: EAL domain-containing protein [Gammaproteobacteria bacterium]|nr:EAL domain-containing protein [Gammaproteobacteria bacterium]